MKEKILVSACLLGLNCKYNGENNSNDKLTKNLEKLTKKYELIAVCPEQMGGLSTPREPCEIVGEKVLNKNGADLTEQFKKGAKECVKIALEHGSKFAILKAKSPSCGSGSIYDGSFSGTLKAGDGLTSKALKEIGLEIFNEENFTNHI